VSVLEILLLAVGLAMDCFAVSLGIGTTRQACAPRPIFRLSFHFGLFQSLMPLLGWFGGSRVAYLIGGVDHWVAFALLGWVGGRMIRSGFDADSESYSCDPSRGRMLVLLSLATSLDALAVGLSLAMLRVDIVPPIIAIGVITALISVLGLRLGSRLGESFGKRTEIAGGLILIGIGFRVLLGHLLV
jgi:manganese efflux pump family protein